MRFYKLRSETLDIKILLLLAGSLVVYVLYGLLISYGDVSDGMFYYSRAGFIADWFVALAHFDFENLKFLTNKIVGPGWFLPATSLILSPVLLFTDDIFVAKIFIYIVNILLHVVVCFKLKKVFNLKVALGFHIITLFNPLYNIFGMSFMGELLAGKCFLLLVLYAIEKTCDGSFDKFNPKLCFGFAFLVFCMMFLRINLAYVAVTFVLLLILNAISVSKIKKSILPLRNAILNASLIGFVTIAFFAPWTIALSNKFETFVFPVTSKYTGKIARIADDDWKNKNLDLGEYASKESYFIFRRVHMYYDLKSKKENRNYIELAKEDVAELKKDYSRAQGIADLKENFVTLPSKLFFFPDKWFAKSFYKLNDSALSIIRFLIKLSFWACMFFTVLFLLTPFLNRQKAEHFTKMKLLFIGTLPHFMMRPPSFHNRHLYMQYPIQILLIVLLSVYFYKQIKNLKSGDFKVRMVIDLAGVVQIIFTCLVLYLITFMIFY